MENGLVLLCDVPSSIYNESYMQDLLHPHWIENDFWILHPPGYPPPEGMLVEYSAQGSRHYSRCGSASMLQSGVSFSKPRFYAMSNGLVLNYASFVFCSDITLWNHLKFMIFTAKSTFPLCTQRSGSHPQTTCTPLHLSLLNQLWAVHRTYKWRTSISHLSPYKRNPPFHLGILTSLCHINLSPNLSGNKWTQWNIYILYSLSPYLGDWRDIDSMNKRYSAIISPTFPYKLPHNYIIQQACWNHHNQKCTLF